MLKEKKLFLLDIDGTVCQGVNLIEGTRVCLKNAYDRKFIILRDVLTRMREV